MLINLLYNLFHLLTYHTIYFIYHCSMEHIYQSNITFASIMYGMLGRISRRLFFCIFGPIIQCFWSNGFYLFGRPVLVNLSVSKYIEGLIRF